MADGAHRGHGRGGRGQHHLPRRARRRDRRRGRACATRPRVRGAVRQPVHRRQPRLHRRRDRARRTLGRGSSPRWRCSTASASRTSRASTATSRSSGSEPVSLRKDSPADGDRRGRPFDRSWLPTAARSPSASSAPVASWVSSRSPSTATRTSDALHDRMADTAFTSDRRRRPKATCGSTGSSTRPVPVAPTRSTPATASCPSSRRWPRRASRRASSSSGRRPRRWRSSATSWPRDVAPRQPACRSCPGRSSRSTLQASDGAASVRAEAERIGWPLLVKAAAGGGGRGMRRVDEPRGS